MKTCACCGQVLPASSPTTIQVDDDLLRVCNEAYAEADRRSAARVEVAHVVLSLTLTHEARQWFQTVAISRLALHDVALRAAGRAESTIDGARLQTSEDLKVLLARAEQVAASTGRAFASPMDFLVALLDGAQDLSAVRLLHEHRPSSELRCSAQPDQNWTSEGWLPPPAQHLPELHVQQPHQQPRQPHHESQPIHAGPFREAPRRPARERQLELELRRPLRDRDQPRRTFDRTSQAEASQRRTSVDAADPHDPMAASPAIIERVNRQDRQLAELRALVGRLMEPREPVDDQGGDPGYSSTRSSQNRNRSSSALRWARVKRDHSSTPRRQTSREADPAGRDDEHDNDQLPDFVRRAVRPPDRQERSERPNRLRLAKAHMRDIGIGFNDPLNTAADNDTEDEASQTGERMKRFYLSPDDDIVKAPSIGPRTAARLIPIGLVLVRDLIHCDPDDIAARAATRYISASRIAEWKSQARLVCTIPWLRGMHAQLLVGAGFDSLPKLIRADASSVCAAVLRFSATREGQSILRSGPAPEIDRIACWIENTALAEPARAA